MLVLTLLLISLCKINSYQLAWYLRGFNEPLYPSNENEKLSTVLLLLKCNQTLCDCMVFNAVFSLQYL